MSEKLNNELLQIIKDGESITTEFKTANNELPKSLFETVCSFLNRFGGNIFLGIGDNGEIIGVNESAIQKMKKDFANLCNNEDKIKPTIYLTLKDYEINEKIVLHVYVPEGSTIYMINRSKIYDRNVDGDYELSNSGMVMQAYMRKNTEYFENKVFPYATLDDLNDDVFNVARKMATNANFLRNNTKKHPWIDMSNEEILRSMNLYEKDLITGKEGLTLAAILLFGKDETILSALPHHKTDAIYRVKNLDRYDDRDDIRTNLIDSYFRLMDFCDKHLDDRFYLEDSQRKDIRSIIAREICANILIHREFSNPFPAKLIIEKNRLITENANKAKQIGKLDVNKFTAYPKNPKIAKVFHELGIADELGSGVRNLFKYTPIYSEGGNPELVENDIFQTIVPINYKYKTTPTTTPTTPTTTPTEDLLNDNQIKIIDLIKNNINIKQDEIASKLNISIDGVKYNMKILKEKKYIERIGKNNDGYWKILK